MALSETVLELTDIAVGCDDILIALNRGTLDDDDMAEIRENIAMIRDAQHALVARYITNA